MQMCEWHDSQKQSAGNFRKLLQERIEQANPRRKLNTEETRRLAKLEMIADKLKRKENVQNRQLEENSSTQDRLLGSGSGLKTKTTPQ